MTSWGQNPWQLAYSMGACRNTQLENHVEGVLMTRVKVYSTGVCPICQKAKALLEKWGIPFTEVRIDLSAAALREYSTATNGARTVPQIMIDGRCVGGFAELTELHMDGALDALMERVQNGSSG